MRIPIKKLIENHHVKILPTIGKYLKDKSILDAGCGNGLNSLIFNEKFNSYITLLDIEDIRFDEVKSFPFVLASVEKIPLDSNSFDVVFLQYVLHHLPPEIKTEKVLAELNRVGKKIIIIEEIRTPKTNIKAARKLDIEINNMIYPGSTKPMCKYFSDKMLKKTFSAAKLNLVEEKIADEGSAENGYLQIKIYVLD